MKSLSLKVEILNDSIFVSKIKHHFESLKTNLTLKIKVKVTNFQNRLRHLDDQFTVHVSR